MADSRLMLPPTNGEARPLTGGGEPPRRHWVPGADSLRHPLIVGGLGLALLLYGGNFKNCVVVLNSLGGLQFELLKAQCVEMWTEYNRARGTELPATSAEATVALASVLPTEQVGDRPETPLIARVARGEHSSLVACVWRFQTAIVAQVGAALNDNCTRLLLGIELGRWTTKIFGDALENFFLSGWKGRSEREEQETRVVVRLALDGACTSACMATAWFLRSWASLWATCMLGSELLVEGLNGLFTMQEGQAKLLSVPIVAGIGFLYQANSYGRVPMPGLLGVLFSPLRVVELGLSCVA